MARAAVSLAFVLAAASARADDPFELREVASPGRTAAAEIADLDGDGRSDLLSVNFNGMPPNETRQVRVFFQKPDGSVSASPDWVGALPEQAAAYDLAEVSGGPLQGTRQLVLLTRNGLTLLSFRGGLPGRRDIPVPGMITMAVAPDERSLDRMQLVRRDLAAQPRLVVPGFLECAILDPTGAVLGRLEVSGRANYYMPPRPGPLISGSEIELHFDHPRLNAGDVDGDGRSDLVAADRHEVRVFHQNENGTFPSRATRIYTVGRVSVADHIRSSGNLAIDLSDLDGDGKADLLISHSSGGLFHARSETRIHLNRGGAWNLAEPSQQIVTEGDIATVQLIDLDGDGRDELIDARVPMGVLQLVEMLLTQAVDTEVAVYRVSELGSYGDDPWFTKRLSIPFNFDTNRPKGFFPDYDADVDNDGAKDLLTGGEGDVVEVFLGGDGAYRKRVASQQLDSAGRLRFGDWNGDGLTDLLIYDPLRPDSPIRLGINRGTLVGKSR